MATKTATIFIVDVGATMGDCHNGRSITDLEYGMQYVWDKMATIMSNGRKGDNVGVVTFRADETDNELADTGDEYSHITMLKKLATLEMEDLQSLQQKITPSDTEEGDAISAIVVAGEAIAKFTTLKTGKPGSFDRKIILLTDGQGEMNGEDITSIAERLDGLKIALTVVGIDFDDENFTEEDKSSIKRQNEALLLELTEKCNDGILGTAEEVLESMATPKPKEVRPIKSYEGILQLGDIEKHPGSSVNVSVVRYPKTKIAKPVSASRFVTNQGSSDDGPQLSSVKNAVTYEVQDTSGGALKWISVEREELAKGYMYGSTIVPFSEDDQNVSRIPSSRSFSIIGFIPSDQYEKYLTMGESSITFAPTSDNKSRLALSSFVHALHELDSYAVARLVLKDGKDPQIVLLAPLIEPDLEALIDVPLPFAEDVRIYRFPPLDKVLTTKGEVLTKHRNLPTDDLVNAMSDYVDSMDLSTFGKDDEGEPTEYMRFDETFSPPIHRINQAIRHRAIYPNSEGVAEPAPVLTKWDHPPEELIDGAAKKLAKLIDVAAVKKVDDKKKGKRGKETVTPLSNLDIDDLLSSVKVKRAKISSNNAIPEFKQMIRDVENDVLAEAVKQLGAITHAQIGKTSIDGNGYEIAVSYIKVMRTSMIELEYPEAFNEFIQDLRKKVAQKGLVRDGDEREFWTKIRTNRLGLIKEVESSFSNIKEDEAEEFLKLPNSLVIREKN